MVGIGTFVLRDSAAIGMIRPYNDDILVLNRLRFDQEIRDYSDLKIPAQKLETCRVEDGCQPD